MFARVRNTAIYFTSTSTARDLCRMGLACAKSVLHSSSMAMHDLDAKRLLFVTEGRDHQTVLDFAADLKAHGGDPAEVRHVCMDMSVAYAKRAAQALPAAAISYDRFHVIAMAIQAMDDVRREELRTEPEEVAAALLGADPKTRRNLLWGMRKSPSGWTMAQTNACTGCSARH